MMITPYGVEPPKFQFGTKLKGLLSDQYAERAMGPNRVARIQAAKFGADPLFKWNLAWAQGIQAYKERKAWKAQQSPFGGFGPLTPKPKGVFKAMFGKEARDIRHEQEMEDAEKGIAHRGMFGDIAGSVPRGAMKVVTAPFKIMAKGMDALEDRFPKVIKGLKGFVKALGYMQLVKIVQSLQGLVQAMNPLTAISETLNEIFSVYGEILQTAFMPIVEKLFETFFSPDAMKLIDGMVECLGLLIEPIKMLVNLLFPVFTSIMEGLKPVIKAISEALIVLEPIFKLLTESLGGLFEAIGPLIAILIKILIPAIMAVGWVVSKIMNIITKIIEWVTNILKRIFGKWINWGAAPAASAANAPYNPNISGVYGEGGVQMATMASGGLVTEPTLALLGERGPEVVLPLASNGLPKSGGIGGGSYLINVYGDVDTTTLEKLNKELWLHDIRTRRRLR